MSIPNLPVNFKDDILASSNPKRKYQQTFNSDGSMSLEDVTQYTQKGSDFGASQVNQTNGAVNNIYDERIVDVEDLSLVTEPGFFVDALAIKEINADLASGSPKPCTSFSSKVTAGESYNTPTAAYNTALKLLVMSGFVEADERLATTDNLFLLPANVPRPTAETGIVAGFLFHPALSVNDSVYGTLRIMPDGYIRVGAPIQAGVRCALNVACVVGWD